MDEFQQTIERIAAYVAHIAGTGLLVCVCDDDELRNHALATLRPRLSKFAQLIETSYDIHSKRLLDFLQNLEGNGRQIVVSVVGLENLPSDNQAEAIKSLNFERNRFGRSGIILLLWVNERLLRRISSQAPDFYSWRSATFFIQPPINWDQRKVELRRYAQSLRSSLNRIGFQSAMAFSGDRPALVDLQGQFVNRRLSPLKTNNFQSLNTGETTAENKGDQGNSNVIVSLANSKRSVIVGEPGMGKTTFLKQIALSLVSTRLRQEPLESQVAKEQFDLLPIYLNLREDPALPDSAVNIGQLAFEAYRAVLKNETTRVTFEQLLSAGEVLLLIDALDELPREHLQNLVQEIDRFIIEYPYVRVTIALRTDVMLASILGREWQWFRLEPLNDSEMVGLINSVVHDEKLARSLIEVINRNNAIKSIARAPLFLSLMAALSYQRGFLPSTRVRIYDEIIKVALFRWDFERGSRRENLRGEIVNKYLAGVAWWMQEHRTSSIEGSTLLEILTGREFRELPREFASVFFDNVRNYAGLFSQTGSTPAGDELFGFVHVTFQEFFASTFLSESWNLTTSNNWGLLVEDQWWHGVIAFAAARLSSPESNRFLNQILSFRSPQALVVAAKALVDGAEAGSAAKETILMRILEISESSDAVTFLELNQSVFFDVLLRMSQESQPKLRAAVAQALARFAVNPVYRTDIVRLLRVLENDSTDIVRLSAAGSLRQLQGVN